MYRVLFLFLLSCSQHQTINKNELIELMKNRQKFQLIDIRTPAEWKSIASIPGAIQKNFFDEDFQSYAQALSKDKTYILYCRSGSRSKKAITIMKETGLDVLEYEGGILDWVSRN